jgi:hypothetical protein
MNGGMRMQINIEEKQAQNYENILLSLMPQDGTTVGNGRLMQKLQWAEDRYFYIRNRLVDRGILKTGRGQGGSVSLVVEKYAEMTASKDVQALLESEELELKLEKDLYEPAKAVIENYWAKEKRIGQNQFKDTFYFVEITAHKRKKGESIGGKWTRPDIALVGYTSYSYVPGKFLDVISFEIKNYNNMAIDALYEALAHLRYVTFSYVLLYVPENLQEQNGDTINRIVDEAQRFGIGVIVASKIDDGTSWDMLVEAVRRDPDPAKLNDFITQQISEENKDKIRMWVG